VGHSVEGEEMMLTHGIEWDVLHQDHLPVPLFKADNKLLLRVSSHAVEDLLIHLGNAARRPYQTLTRRVVPDGFNQIDYRLLHSGQINHGILPG
jgi:hypothetical protein